MKERQLAKRERAAAFTSKMFCPIGRLLLALNDHYVYPQITLSTLPSDDCLIDSLTILLSRRYTMSTQYHSAVRCATGSVHPELSSSPSHGSSSYDPSLPYVRPSHNLSESQDYIRGTRSGFGIRLKCVRPPESMSHCSRRGAGQLQGNRSPGIFGSGADSLVKASISFNILTGPDDLRLVTPTLRTLLIRTLLGLKTVKAAWSENVLH